MNMCTYVRTPTCVPRSAAHTASRSQWTATPAAAFSAPLPVYSPPRSSGSHHNVTGERYDGVFKRGQKNGVGIWKHAAGVSRRRPSPARLPLAAASAR